MCLSCRSLIKSSGSSSATSAGECERLGGCGVVGGGGGVGEKKSLSLRGEKKRQRGLVVASFVAAVFAFPWKKKCSKRGGKSCSDRSLCSVTPRGERGGKKRGKKGKKETRKEKRTPARVPRKEPHFGLSCLQRGKAKEKDLKRDN